MQYDGCIMLSLGLNYCLTVMLLQFQVILLFRFGVSMARKTTALWAMPGRYC